MKLKRIALAGLGLLAVQAQAADMPAVVRAAPPAELANASLTAQQVGGDLVQLNWSDTATGENGYVVQRSANKGPWKTVATLPAGSTNATLNAPLLAGANYRYRVMAVNGVNTGHQVSATADINVAP